ncbi:MAG TPA: MMPL family transporter [Mycobacteriales bacterium]|nr:MMPL family transporter [Mycobacteriales bacterium]
MHAAYAALGRFAVRRRWFVVLFWIVATILATRFFPSLGSVTKSDNTDFLPKNSPSSVASRLASPLQNSKLTPVPVVISRTGSPLTDADRQYVGKLSHALQQVPHVVKVADLGQSPDGRATQLLPQAKISFGEDGPIKKLVKQLRAAMLAQPPPAGVQTHLAGELADQVDQQAKGGTTESKIEGLSVLFILILLIIIFRSPLAPLVTLAPAFLISQLAGYVIAEMTKIGLEVSSLSRFMLIVLVLGAGTDYGLFLVFRIREEVRGGMTYDDAIVRAVERVGESVTFSAGTVIAALLSLLAATFGIYSSLGAPLAIAIFLMLLAGLTLLPALLAILGRAVFWPAYPKPETSTKPPLWGRAAGRIVARPVATLVLGVLIFGGFAAAVAGYKAAGFGNALSAPKGTDAAAGDAVVAAHFPKASANPTNLIFRFDQPVWTEAARLDQAQAALAKHHVFSSVTGPTTPNGIPVGAANYVALHRILGDPNQLPANPPRGSNQKQRHAYAVYRTEANYVSADGRTVQYLASLTAGDPSTTDALHAVPAIRKAVADVGRQIGAAKSAVGGEAAGIYDVSSTSNGDLKTVVPIAIAVIGVLLALVMRSLIAPLYLIVSVAVSYLAALGVSVLAFQIIGGSGGLTFLLPFLLFLFLLALGEDYNILVMSRIREEAHSRPLRDAVREALAATGSTVTSAGLVLAGTFAVFAIAGSQGNGGSQFRDLGFGLSIGILMDTFLVRTLLVPSTVALLGKWNWWPSKLHDYHEELERQQLNQTVASRD